MRSWLSLTLVYCLAMLLMVEQCRSGPVYTDTTLDQLKEIFDNFPVDYEYQLPPLDKLSPEKRQRACLINAGLSQGCDLSDILMAKQQASKFASFSGPGRRRKRSADTFRRN